MKPLGIKSYGSIGHLLGSRMGPSDHHVHDGQHRICTEKSRDKNDVIIVQEKLDGSCMAVLLLDNKLLALGRAGYLAQTSRFEQHQIFAHWVRTNESRFREVLQEGERIVGEWLAQAHGTRYELSHDPFVPFDIMVEHKRLPIDEFNKRVLLGEFPIPKEIHRGSPLSIESAMKMLTKSFHGALDPVEGAIWRVEHNGKVDFLSKYVRPDKIDGAYLPEISQKDPVWNWRP